MKAKLDSYLSYLRYVEDQLKKGEAIEPFEEIEIKADVVTLKGKQSSSDSTLKFSFSPDLYDVSASILKLGGKEINLPSDRNEDYLCRVIFSSDRNMRKEWVSIDVIEASKDRIVSRSKNPDREPWRPVYNAARRLNDRVERKIGINDLFLVKPVTTVKINPKYLV